MLLFGVGLINQLAHYRKWARLFVLRAMRTANGDATLHTISIVLNNRTYQFQTRVGDLADYQTIWECFSGMYPFPEGVSIRSVFDGGANVGLFSISVAANYGDISIVAVEPDESNFDLLERNLAVIPRVQTAKAALAAFDGKASFVRPGANTGHIVPSSADDSEAQVSKTYEVEARRLTNLIPSEWSADSTWVKLDIEGAEFDVLADMFRCGYRPVAISGEIHDFLHLDGEGLLQRIRDEGYAIRSSGSGDEGNVCRQFSALLISESRPQ